jgi:two-component system response regulator RegX3
MRILLVEDDPSIAEPLVDGLERQGYELTWVSTGADALNADPGDMVLLDLGLPDLDGQVVCRKLREKTEVPIIVVTARSDEIDRVALLELGADDYLIKPFGFRELVARMRAVARRSTLVLEPNPVELPDAPMTLGDVTLDRRTRKVAVSGIPVSLTPKEFDLLEFLAQDPGAVLTRERIIEEVWDKHWWGSTKTLDVHIASLRKKLADTDLIETVRGVGYRLAVDEEGPET